MVTLQSIRDETDKYLIDDTVSTVKATLPPKDAITVVVSTRRPFPAWAKVRTVRGNRPVLVDFGPKAHRQTGVTEGGRSNKRHQTTRFAATE